MPWANRHCNEGRRNAQVGLCGSFGDVGLREDIEDIRIIFVVTQLCKVLVVDLVVVLDDLMDISSPNGADAVLVLPLFATSDPIAREPVRLDTSSSSKSTDNIVMCRMTSAAFESRAARRAKDAEMSSARVAMRMAALRLCECSPRASSINSCSRRAPARM